MWKTEIYNGTQDLSNFYLEAEKKGFYNNSSPEMLIGYIEKYNDATLHLLYFKNLIVGTVVSHRLKELNILDKNAYRIAARTCVLTHLVEGWKSSLKRYDDLIWNNPTAQFLIPACISHVGRDASMYISTHTGNVGKQNAVHRIWTKAQVDAGILKTPIEIEYKNSFQTFWKVDVDKFEEIINANKWH